MFTQTWNKYLPIIRILMKRTVNGPQTLDMNRTDFERAAGGRKVKFTFAVSLHKGRIQNMTSPPPLAKELSTILQEDEVTRKMIRMQDYDFSLNASFQLTMKNNAPAGTTESAEGETSEEKANGHAEKNSASSA